MQRFLIYLFPAMVDMVVAGILFVFGVRVAATQPTASQVTAVTITWAITYMVVSQIAGKITSPSNSAKVITSSTIILAASALGFLVFEQLWVIYPLMVLAGIGCALFFAPFQVFMKTIEVNHGDEGGIVKSTALYTFSWSAGFAAGPFVCGFIYQHYSWQACCWLFIVMSLLTTVGIQLLKHFAETPHQSLDKGESPQEAKTGYESMPDLVWLGWIGSGMGILACFMIRALFPDTGAHFKLTESEQGMILAALSMTQALTGLALIGSKLWMYRTGPMLLFGLSGLTGMFLFGLGETFWIFILAAICFGIYSGSFFFYFVFHAIVHPEHSGKYVAINESIVGLAGFIGPLVGGALADGLSPSAPYLLFSIPVIGALVFQTIKKSNLKTT